jgi:amiloride-sensitive sodium channel
MSLVRRSERKVKTSLFDLLSNTSTIHGIKYIGDHQSPRASRTFWVCAFTLSILGCIYYATQVYDKWYVTPDIGLKVEYKSSRNVPFPALTICPQTKVRV